LVIFDGTVVRDTATFEEPHQYPHGIKHVLINGTLVVEKWQAYSSKTWKGTAQNVKG
jgi:N-acyl-D-aspartate/D-glutamate deacylase